MTKGFMKTGLLVIAGFILAVVAFNTRSAFATYQNHDQCTYSCPVVHFEWNTTVYDNCPSGYSVRNGHSDQCQKNSYPWTVITRPSHTVHHSANVQYDKSQDPNKCHRPSDNDLSTVYGMDSQARASFKSANNEWKESMKVCVTPTATNTPTPTPTVEVTPTPTDEVTPTPTIDPCSEVRVLKDDIFDDNPCITPTPTETPEATPTPELKQEEHHDTGPSTNTTSAPVCQDGNTVNLPANVHVLRSGNEATVNFFITQGDSANIYYKELGENGWTHSVLRDEVKKYVNGDKYVSYTIHDLDPNLGYVFGVEQVQGCGGGQLVTAVVVDGPLTQLFMFSYWEWSK